MKQIKYLTNEQIKNYVFNKLSEAEETEIDEFLDANDDYRDAVNGLMDMCLKENLTEVQFEKLMDKHPIIDGNKDIEPAKRSKGKKVVNLRSVFSIALAAAIVAGLGYFLFNIESTVDYPLVEARHQTVALNRGGEALFPEDARNYYDKKEFKRVLVFKYLEEDLANPNVQFYLGLSALQLKIPDLGAAEDYFKYVIMVNGELKNDALYYLAQVYLLKNNNVDCLKCLGEIEGFGGLTKGQKKLQKKCSK